MQYCICILDLDGRPRRENRSSVRHWPAANCILRSQSNIGGAEALTSGRQRQMQWQAAESGRSYEAKRCPSCGQAGRQTCRRRPTDHLIKCAAWNNGTASQCSKACQCASLPRLSATPTLPPPLSSSHSSLAALPVAPKRRDAFPAHSMGSAGGREGGRVRF